MSAAAPTLNVIASLIDNLTVPLKQTADTVSSVVSGMSSVFSAFGVTLGAIGIEQFAASAFDAAEKMRQSQGALAVALQASGYAWDTFGQKAETAVQKVADFSTFTDTDLRAALATLVQDTGDAQGSMNNLGLVADIATAKHIDLESAAKMVAKAMEGNVTAFQRAGISVDTTKDIIGQAKVIFSGAAEEALKLDGGVSSVGKSWTHFKEAIGASLESFNQATGFLDKAAGLFQGLAAAVAHPIQAIKLWTGVALNADDVVALSTTKLTEVVTTSADKRIAGTNKQADAAAKAMHAAADQIVTENQRLLDAQQKVSDSFLKDFGTGMPAAAGELQVKISDLSKNITDWQGKESTAQANALAAYKANNQELGDMYSNEADGIATTLDGWEKKRALYQAVLPVYSQLSDVAKAVTAAESDPNPHMKLLELNDALTVALGLRASTLGNSAAQKDLDAQISTIQKDIATATKDTQIAGADLTGPLEDQKRLEQSLSDMARDRATKAQAISDAEMQSAKTAIGLAASTGLIDDNLANTLTSAIGIGQSLAGGDYAGAIAGFGSLLNSVFSDAKSAAIRALMQKNNEQLAALTAIQGKLVDQTDSGAKIQRVIDALTAVGANTFIPGGGMGINSGDVANKLVSNGGSFQDVVDLAKAEGIDLGNTNQQTSLALTQLLTALKGASFQSFGSDFQGQLDQSTFQEGLTGGNLTAGDYQSALSSSQGSSYIANQLFQGLDLTNMSGADWQTLQGRITTLGGQANSLTNDQVGNLSRGQVTTTLSGLAGIASSGITAAADKAATNKATAVAGLEAAYDKAKSTLTSSSDPATIASMAAQMMNYQSQLLGLGVPYGSASDFIGLPIPLTPEQIDVLAQASSGSNPYATGPLTSDTSAPTVPDTSTSATTGSAPVTTLTLPTVNGGVSLVADASGASFSDVISVLGGKLDRIGDNGDTSNDKLDTLIDSNAAIVNAITGGALGQTAAAQLQRLADLATASVGG